MLSTLLLFVLTAQVLAGALARPFYYGRLARTLARFGFIVAMPDYTIRDLFTSNPALTAIQQFVLQTRREGVDCPINGQFVTAKLLTSVIEFFMDSSHPIADIRTAVDLQKTVIFGHTFGGAIAERLFNDACVPFVNPVVPPPARPSIPILQERTACEQYTPLQSSQVKILGLITYEGFTQRSILPVPEGTFYTVIHSPFYFNNIDNFFGGKVYDGRAAIVQITNANHYAPGNFVTANGNQRPPCVRVRPPPEDMFTTTAFTQKKVIKSIAKIILRSYNVYVQKTTRRRLSNLVNKAGVLVANVTFI